MEKEKRQLQTKLEVRTKEENGKQVKIISGYAVKFNEESYILRDRWGDEFIEVVAPEAFNETLKDDIQKALYDHITSIVIGNTRTGTLKLFNDNIGLKFELELPESEWGSYIFEGVRRGDIDGVSFGFDTIKDKYDEIEKEGRSILRRTLLQVKLYEISPTPWAAYPSSEISCRSLETYKNNRNLENEKRSILKELEESEKLIIKCALDY